MAQFKRVARIVLSNIGGELDSILADSTESSSIGAAMRELEARCNFECGDTITIEEVETEIE